MNIGSWLQDLGLERYIQTFRDHEVDLDVLGDLTEADLEKLGIPLGHRKKLLRAIARRAEPETPVAAELPRAEAERRQLTVMFVDLVGSTELSTRLDPEDMGALIRSFQDCCAKVVKRWGGHLAKFMGDGALVYFGWPQAHEDDAERAVRAGLELARAVATLSTPADARLAVRIGIATGPVLVGELAGAGAAHEEVVVGETPNLAARLQALAEPGTVVVAARTRRLLGGLFELLDLGPVRLKGFAEAMSAFRVEGEGHTEGRFEAFHGGRLTPLVGREHELAVLMERWARAKDGEGQVVLLAGEPGIGKSRLLRALREQLSDEPHVVLRHFCSPYHTNSALHPIISQLERAAGLTPGDEAEVKLARLEALLGQATQQLDEALPLLAALLGIPTGDRYPALNLSPQRKKQRTLEVLLEQLAGLARERPVLELYEDLHWVDPSTLELLDLLVEGVRRLPVLGVLTYRPEFSPPWTGQAHVTALPLNRLGQRQGAAMVARLTAGKALPDEVLGEILVKTDGVPLFVEELTKAVLESSLLEDSGDRFVLAGPLPPLAIPATLRDSLMARLDRLAAVKEVAQTAAVIGREFSHALVAAVSPLSEAELTAAFDRLVRAELIFRRGTPPQANYSFKHALLRDEAYQSLLKSTRQALHGRIAAALETHFPERADAEPGVLAHHHAEAGDLQRACAYWSEAGRRAAARWANREAIDHLSKAIDAMAFLPETPDGLRRELDVLLVLGPAQIAAYGFAAPVVERTYARAETLCDRLGDPTSLPAILQASRVSHMVRPDLVTARRLGERILAIAQQREHAACAPEGHLGVGIPLCWLGELASARHHLERASALSGVQPAPSVVGQPLGDTAVIAGAYSGLVLWPLGYPTQSASRSDQAIARARSLAHPFSLGQALGIGNFQGMLGRRIKEVAARADELTAIAEEHGFPIWRTLALLAKGWAQVETGLIDPGLAALREALVDIDQTRLGLARVWLLTRLVEALIKSGSVAEGNELLAEARAFMESTRVKLHASELARLQGELLLRGPWGDPARAEVCFQEALAIARAQAARSFELRAATSLARLWAEQGERRKAYDLLAPIYAWFTEGFDTTDLQETKALLEELA